MNYNKERKNVLFISYDGMTDPLGQSQVIPYLSGLSKHGYQITILSFEKPDKFDSDEVYIRELLVKNNINWKPIKYHKNPPILSSIYDLLMGFYCAIYICLFDKINMIHCRGNYMTSLIAYIPLKIRRMKYVFDMRGFWPDERVDGGVWDLKNPIYYLIYHFFKFMEKRFIQSADIVITLTYNAKDYIQKNFILKNEVVVIPCAADLNHFKPQEKAVRDNIRLIYNIENEYVIGYLGSVGTWYMLSEMLDFFNSIISIEKKVKFFFLTNDNPKHIIKEIERKKLDLSKFIITSAKRNELPKLISAWDASIFFIKPVFSKRASSPTKHGELLGSHIPVICNAGVGDMEMIMNERKTGVVIKEFNSESYKDGFKKILNERYNKSDFDYVATKYYSLEIGIEKYLFSYKQLYN